MQRQYTIRRFHKPRPGDRDQGRYGELVEQITPDGIAWAELLAHEPTPEPDRPRGGDRITQGGPYWWSWALWTVKLTGHEGEELLVWHDGTYYAGAKRFTVAQWGEAVNHLARKLTAA